MRRCAEMRVPRSSVLLSALWLLPLSCYVRLAAGYPFKTPLDLDVTPRITVLTSGKEDATHIHTLNEKLPLCIFILKR